MLDDSFHCLAHPPRIRRPHAHADDRQRPLAGHTGEQHGVVEIAARALPEVVAHQVCDHTDNRALRGIGLLADANHLSQCMALGKKTVRQCLRDDGRTALVDADALVGRVLFGHAEIAPSD